MRPGDPSRGRPRSGRRSFASTPDGRLSAQDRVALEELSLIEARLAKIGAIDAAVLSEKRDRVLPHDGLHRRLVDLGLAHGRHRLGHLERITYAPVGGAVDED